MTTINLYQNNEKSAQSASQVTANMGFIFSLSILIITILAIAGLKFASYEIDKENVSLQADLDQQTNSLVGLDDLQKVVSLENKLALIRSNLQITNKSVGRIKMTDILGSIEKDMAPGVVLKTYTYEGDGKVKVNFTTSNFSDSAKQILNFKKSAYFSNAALSNISRSEKEIESEMTMNIKNKK